MSDLHSDPAAIDAGIARATGARSLLVALDFDGTLAPFADDAGAVSALPGAWAAALTLDRARDTHVALVSGRPLAGLAEVSHAPEHMALVGSHGVEWRVDGHDEAALTADEQTAVDRIGAILDAVGERFPGVHIEHKPAGHGVHTRRVDADTARAADDDARTSVLAEFPDTTVRGGKDILEFAVRTATKGDAIERLRALFDADVVVFAGDDVTDEDGFRVLRSDDVGVKVGPGDTAATLRVADPEALVPVLQQLARARAFR